MSAPGRSVRDSQEISYGFLSAKASIALQHALQNQPLSQDDVSVLHDAARFLKDIAEGALITTGNVLEGVSASRSIAALDVAFGPLATLKQMVQSESQIAPFFQSLSDAVSTLAVSNSTTGVKPQVQNAQQFFDGLSSWLLEELSLKSRTLGKAGLRAV